MQFQLNHIVTTPLKDIFSQRQSDIWNKDITFFKEEYIKIKAPSGTGKTTFIHILYKLRHDFEGQVLYDSTNIIEIQKDELAIIRQQKISIIFQDLRLFPNLTAAENIELKRVMQTPIYEKNIIHEMAEKLGIVHILKQKAGLCSYGEQQRIAIIRALVQPFDWLLMDEPFSHLDEQNTHKAALLIAEECAKRKAGFIITDLDEDNHFNYTKKLLL